MNKTFLRRCLAHLLALTSALAASSAIAQQVASGPIKFVVPFPPGTTIDVLARDLSAKLPAVLGRPIVVENRAGAGGNIGTEYALGQPADGSTFLVTVHSPLTINPLIYEKLRYSPNDFIPVTNLITGGYILVANNNTPYKSLAELVAAGKARPDQVTFASHGYGSMTHICMEQLQATTGARFRHVPYKNLYAGDMMAGVVDMGFDNIGSTTPNVNAKKLVPLALSYKRMPQLPGVPAVAESYAGYECFSWVGVLAPKGTPAAAVRQMNLEINKIMATPAFATLADTLGTHLAPTTVEQFTEFYKADIEKWRKLVPPLNIKLD
ncbi:tripartite tricarboxylate transporter substrate binding protein [Variovorax sp. KK3]|uniref:Bug family tripartite tricarboxylate transporter substrate binding protein n=1 Tax=Variovorax sp. KK3 TaxID=1855728 RepID=UPI00097C3E2F|nr:tripartite tricarboxylate transporter substrate binding protein [Variovorax sp. KK3]